MTVKLVKVLSFIFLISFFTLFFRYDALCQQPASLKEGIEQYKDENYEEAIEVLKKARKQAPRSSVAAFFLGLAYKQVLDYQAALGQLRDAVTMTPRIKEALVELIDVTIQLKKLEESKKWIEVAEKENIAPAKVAFLKGLLLSQEGKNLDAVESFEKAKSIDKSITQAADIQIAIAYLKERELKKAKERFQTAVIQDPQTDLAGFARQYLDMVEKRIFLERPFRFTVGLLGQYDTNMTLNPTDYEPVAVVAPGSRDNQASRVLNSSFRVNYVPALKGPWLLNAQYSFSSSLHQKNTHTHDSFSNSISVTPGYNFGKSSLNLATSYTHSHVRGPSYKEYSGAFSSGPLFRMALKNDQLLELFAGYSLNEFFQPPLTPAGDRDSDGVDTYVSWIWLFKRDAFFNLKYQYTDQDTDGSDWDYNGHSYSVNLTMPLIEKVKLQLSGQANEQDYKNIHSYSLIEGPERDREDTIYTLSGGVTWDFYKNATMVAQVSKIRSDSNIAIYDYKRNLYTLGIEYRF